MRPILLILMASSVTLLVAGCSGSSSSSSSSSATEDSSASSAAANSTGGAIASSDSSGTMAMNTQSPWRKLLGMFMTTADATSFNACPTVTSTLLCAANGSALDLTYSDCNMGSSSAVWNGTLEVSLSSGSGATLTCGSAIPVGSIASGHSVQRQFVTSGFPGVGTRTSALGTLVDIDDSSSNLANFDTGTTIAANIGTGYGSQVTFNGSGVRTGVTVKERLYSTAFDHSVDGTLSIAESGTTRTVTGSVLVYHNKLRVVGTSTFNNVIYNNTCCHPVSGSITTVFAAGTHVSPTTLGSAAVGKTESLTFTSCGTALYTNTVGATTTVSEGGCF